MAATYDYLVYTLPRGRAAWTEFANHVRSAVTQGLIGTGVELVGLFSPQLGFASNEAVVLIRSKDSVSGLPNGLTTLGGAIIAAHDHLLATARPRDADRLQEGGIYVHRWFTIDGDRADDFVDLSNRAWVGFEGTYDTAIFGLFRASPSSVDHAEGAARLFLLTWYKNHAVWETSREQAHDTKSLFAQRHQLTRTTIGKSSVCVV